MKTVAILILFFLFISPAIAHSEDFYEAQLNSGIRNSDTYSYLLIREAEKEGGEKAVNLLKKALTISPDLPAVYFALSRASFSYSGSGLYQSIDYIVQGVDAYSRNFWWSFTLTGSVFFSLIISFILAIAVLIIIRLFNDVPLISHDIKENFGYAILLLFIIFLSLASPLLLLSGLLLILGSYMRKLDRVVVYLFFSFLLISPLVFKTASLFMNGFCNGKVKAITQINESRSNNYELKALGSDQEDYSSLFSYGLALKRAGHYSEAAAVYTKLIEKKPSAEVFVNLGNCNVGLYNFRDENKAILEEAMKNYLAAVNIKPLASAYYNLSTISREMLDYPKGEEYFNSALKFDRVAVSEYRSISARTPNRIVADETLKSPQFWEYARKHSDKVALFGLTNVPLSALPLLAVILFALSFLLDKFARQRAYRCKKCNTIMCVKCENSLTWGQMCGKCYASLVKLSEMDMKERVARILSLYDRQSRRRNILKIMCLIMPGSSQVYSGKILFGFLILWPFLFFVSVPLACSAVAPDHEMLSHTVFIWASVGIAAVIYLASVLITLKRISKGWL